MLAAVADGYPDGPTLVHRQYLVGKMMGPRKSIGGSRCIFQWAHPSALGANHRKHNGPRQSHWQQQTDILMGPSQFIGCASYKI